MKTSLMMILLSFSLVVSAQEKNESNSVVVGSGAVVAAGSGYMSYRKFSFAKSTVEANTEMLLAHSGKAGIGLSAEEIAQKTAKIEEGDKVIFKYHLNEVKNRHAWVEHYTDMAASERSNASSYRGQAAAALLETEEIRDAQGRVTGTRLKPNLASALMYNNMASQADANAERYVSKANDVRAGAPVEWMEFEKEFNGKNSGKAAVAAEMKSLLDDGGKVFSLSRLPKAMVKVVKNANVQGGIFAGIAVLSTGAAVYEYATGEISGSFAANSRARFDGDRQLAEEKPSSQEKKNKMSSSAVLLQ
jgi:hypothetical protein